MVKVALRYYILNKGQDWPNFLPMLQAQLNNSHSATTGFLLNEIIYGFNLREGLSTVILKANQRDLTTLQQLYRVEAADAISFIN